MEGRSTGPISSLIWLLGDSIFLVAHTSMHCHGLSSVVSYQHFFCLDGISPECFTTATCLPMKLASAVTKLQE